MNRERWQRIEAVFQAALERPADGRAAFLDGECAGDKALHDEVVAMLAEVETDPTFLSPLVDPSGLGSADAAGAGREPGAEGQRFGPYRLIREVGAGGMGVVYLAIHEGPGFERPVALKVIRRGLDTEELLKRFQLERRILASLQHPNIARLTDAGQTPDGRPYFVMDFVEGAPLDVHADREHLGLAHRLRLFETVCRAVQHAHNSLVVHRDLKPGNIIVRADGEPVLLDFGIGKLIDPQDAGEGSTTRTGARAFTPEYASPEQIRGEPVSTATDIYGLGLLLYRLLTGRRPFEPSSGFEYEKKVLEAEPTRPSSFGNRALAGDLDTIILKALRKEPERRYTSVAALSDDIRRYLDGLPVRARADTFGYVAGKFLRRNRVVMSAAATVFLSLIAATAYSVFQARAVTRERDKAVAVQTFLLEMFGASGGRGDSVSVRQLLDGQVQLVPIAYANDDELRALMLSVVAEGYDRLSAFAPAESLARAALDLRRATLRPNHPELATSVSFLGWVLHERGKSKEGEALLREALALWPTVRPRNPGLHARTLNDLGVVREASGAYDEAADLYRQALTIRRALAGGADRATAVTGSNLSVVLYRKGDFKGAVAEAEAALAVMRRLAGPDHQRSSLIQGNLAAFRVGMGDLRGAEAEYRELTERQTRVQGRVNQVTAGMMLGLASVLRQQQRFAEAETLLVEVVTILETTLGREHSRVANAESMLGGVLSGQKRFREARPHIERSLAIHRKLRGAVHRDVAITLGVLGTLHSDAGDLVAAERLFRESVGVFEGSVGKKHVETATARARLAAVVYRRRRYDEALALYRDAHDVMVAAGVQPTSLTFRDTRIRLAQSLVALKRGAEADSILTLAEPGASATHKALIDSLRQQARIGR